ncbi:MAG: PEP-CTERM sorting domain-containing protein, partial [Pirellulaceae bacterium]|nr:PEP-CTERM sorting domain-containing protein [Pirellulaceae bacterium]
SFSQSEMGWRTSASLGFANLVFGTRADVGDETRAWSIDSISIAQLSVEPPVFVDTVAARFNDGETTLEVDGYPGKAGLGWNGPWTHTASEGVTSGVALLDSSPLKPGENSGNYVQVVNSHANRSDDTPSYSGFSRDYKAPTGGVDWTKEHTIEFSIRIDEDLTAGNFNTVNDRYHASNVNNTRNTDNTASWMVYVCGGEGAYANADDVGEWVFYDGNRDSGAMDVNRTVSSDIVVVSGTVYDFTIVVDPETQSYVGSITDGVNSYTTGTLGWRRASTEIGSYLMFDTRGYLVADEFESANERMFSLDNVIITQSLARIPGDTDNDGKVDDVDAKVLATYWGSSVAVGDVTKGDFNADGVVNAIDAAILAAHWGDHNVAMESTPVGVPEPSTLLLLLAGGIAGLLTRARRA